MTRPSVDPTSISLKAEPGDTHIAVVSIAKAPSTASVTAAVIDGNSLITIRRLRSFRVVRRPFTEEEIDPYSFRIGVTVRSPWALNLPGGSISVGSASFTKSYEDTGVLGTLEDIVSAVGSYLGRTER